MKKFSFLILAITFFVALPSYSNPKSQKNNFGKMRNRFEKIDKDGDGTITKEEFDEYLKRNKK